MVFHGQVRNGRIELDEPGALPEGADVQVTIVRAESTSAKKSSLGKSRPPAIEEELARIAAGVPESEWAKLPADLNDHLDHYLYGTPKQ